MSRRGRKLIFSLDVVFRAPNDTSRLAINRRNKSLFWPFFSLLAFSLKSTCQKVLKACLFCSIDSKGSTVQQCLPLLQLLLEQAEGTLCFWTPTQSMIHSLCFFPIIVGKTYLSVFTYWQIQIQVCTLIMFLMTERLICYFGGFLKICYRVNLKMNC